MLDDIGVRARGRGGPHQAHLQFSSSLREGVEWGGGWERINSFSFFKENKQYKRMINNSAASL